jgi:hypothetical protein
MYILYVCKVCELMMKINDCGFCNGCVLWNAYSTVRLIDVPHSTIWAIQ